MAINLLDMVQSQLGGAAMSQIGKFLGEDESKAQAGMGAALPTLLGSVIQKSTSVSGANSILDILNSGGYDGSMFDNLGALLGGGNATNNLLNSGSTLIDFFLGDRTQSVTDLIIRSTGLGKGATGSILRLAAPMLISMLGKHVKSSGLNAAGLMRLLKDQKEHVAAAAPAGLGDVLGLEGLGESLKETASPVDNTADKAVDTGKSWISRILPWAVIAALLFGAYWFFTGRKPAEALSDATDAVGNVVDKTAEAAGDAANAVGDAAGNVADAAGKTVDAVGEAASEALDAATEAARTTLSSVKFAAGSAGESLYNLFKSGGDMTGKAVTFKNLTFATGSAEITPETAIEIDNLAKVLNAYPQYKVEIGGHTDNTGDAQTNLRLSEARAVAVTKRLVRVGNVDRSRISYFGYGDGQPIGDNNTEEGRAANRRIEIKIVE